MRGPWHAVDGGGRDLATGRPPGAPGWPSPAAALAAAPVVTWPLALTAGEGERVGLGAALGPGGDRVEQLLDALTGRPQVDDVVEVLARSTPGGTVSLPLAVLGLPDAVEASAAVDPRWMAAAEAVRERVRTAVVEAGREDELEAALHVVVLLATERLDPVDDADVDAHVASGAQLWLLTGAAVSALAGAAPDPFEAWARLVAAGWWPVGPSGGRLVVARTRP